MENTKSMTASAVMNQTDTSLMKAHRKEEHAENRTKVLWNMFQVGLSVFLMCLMALPVFAADGDASAASNAVGSVGKIVMNIIIAMGSVMAALGVYHLARSFSSHDPAQKTQGIEFIAGGAIAIVVTSIVKAVGGTVSQ